MDKDSICYGCKYYINDECSSKKICVEGELNKMTLEKLYEMQKELDKYIIDKRYNDKLKELGYDEVPIFSGNDKSFLSDRILALFTEVGEFANATRCFKYWSSKSSESKERLLDEYVDMLHFFLSIGNTMGFTPEEVGQAYKKKWEENFKRQEEGY